jgi:hypothetical protein
MDNNKGPQLCFVAPLELLLHKLHFFSGAGGDGVGYVWLKILWS